MLLMLDVQAYDIWKEVQNQLSVLNLQEILADSDF